MTENRYIYKVQHRRKRHYSRQLKEGICFDADVDQWDRHVVERQRQREMLHGQNLLTA